MDFLPDRLINCDIIFYTNSFYFIYQYQEKDIVTCAAAKMDSSGNIIGKPFILDTTIIKPSVKKKVYNILASEDKQKILIYKATVKTPGIYVFTTFLFNSDFKLLNKFFASIPVQAQDNFFSDFSLDNNGTIAFVKADGNLQSNNITNPYLFVKNLHEDSFMIYSLNIGNVFLSNIYLKADNINNHFIVTSLFLDTKEKYVQGIYCSIWDNNKRTITASKEIILNNDYRNSLKPKLPSPNILQYLYIQNIEVKKDGGFVVMAEITFSLDEEKSDNSQFVYPYSSQIRSSWQYQDPGPEVRAYPWLSPYNLTSEDYYAYNIAIMSFNSNADMDWSNTLPKAQYSHRVYKFIGFGVYITSGKMNFLFNKYFKQKNFLQSISFNAEGRGNVNPIINVLGKTYECMPKYGKQVSSNEIIIPCQYVNYLCFAKIEF